ncbi:hypothetical protein ACJZ2D_014587 [Fusarium nematophilum]
MSTTNDRQPGRRLHMFNCTFCRKDKKKCNPEHTHKDNRGDTLVQYAMAHGLDCPELAVWWDFTEAVENFYPEREENILGDGPGGDFQFSNDSLSPWIASQSQLWQPV